MDTIPAEKAYRVLARKYRPQSFDDLIGQEPMVRTLTNAFEAGRIAQAWMLTGVRGVGKTTTARILARALNYKTPTIDRPTVDLKELGEHCQAIMEGRHVDVVEMDAASHTGIDDIREIIEQVRYKPVSARYKVYIIDEVHMLSTQAFNGLLKTLEEPPTHVKFIFATTEIRKVPITVLSRCQRFDLRRIESPTMAKHLRFIVDNEKVEADNQALAMIARAGEGSVRDALSILDQAIAHGDGRVDAEVVRSMLGLADRARIIDLFELVMKGDIAATLHEFKSQYDCGADPLIVLNELAQFNHFITRLRFTPEMADDVSLSEEERSRGLTFSQKLSIRVLSRNWQMLLKGIKEVESANNPMQAAEMLLIRLAHAADLPTLDEALKSLKDGEQTIMAPQTPPTTSQTSGVGTSHHTPSTTQNDGAASHAPHHDITPSATSSQQPVMQLVSQSQFQPQVQTEPHLAINETAEPAMDPTPMARFEDVPPPEPTDMADSVIDNGNLDAISPQQTDTAIAGIPVEPSARVQTSTGPAIHSIIDMVQLADEKREIQFKIMLKEFIRPVSFGADRIEIEITEGAPRDIAQQMGKYLREWTGERWTISVVNEGGGKTIAEQEIEARDALFDDARADPEVQAIINAFPGAKVVDVRLRADEQGTIVEENSHNDALVMDESDDDNDNE